MNPSESSSTLETIAAMLQQEARAYRTMDFLVPQGNDSHLDVDADCRCKMATWCYQVVDFCSFNRESVAIAMNYLDRFVAVERRLLTSRSDYQLAAMTCLYTSIKLNEPEAIDPQTVSDLSKGAYTAAQVEEMERHLVNALQWRMNPPTAMSFVRCFLDLLSPSVPEPFRTAIYDIAKFQTELAVSEYDFLIVPPSIVAYCAVLNALEALPHVCDKMRAARMGHVLAHAIQLSGDAKDTVVLQRVQGCLFAAVVQSDTVSLGAASVALVKPVAVRVESSRSASCVA